MSLDLIVHHDLSNDTSLTFSFAVYVSIAGLHLEGSTKSRVSCDLIITVGADRKVHSLATRAQVRTKCIHTHDLSRGDVPLSNLVLSTINVSLFPSLSRHSSSKSNSLHGSQNKLAMTRRGSLKRDTACLPPRSID